MLVRIFVIDRTSFVRKKILEKFTGMSEICMVFSEADDIEYFRTKICHN